MNFVGIDTGRATTKVITDCGDVIQFPSVIGSGRELNLEASLEFDVWLDGRHYFVGHLAEESFDRRAMATASKIHEETKVLFLTALAAATSGEPCTITTGLPVAQHNPATKAALTNLLAGRHRVRINGRREMVLEVGSIVIVPEGAGAFWDAVLNDQGKVTDQALLRQPVVRVIDLGSRTVNYVTLLEGRYLNRSSDTLQYGCMELEAEENTPENFTRRIVADLTRRWPDLKKTDLVFLAGGGALIMRDSLAQEFPMLTVAQDPVTANARGYRKLGLVYAQKSQGRIL